MNKIKSFNLEEIINKQRIGLKDELINFIANTSNNRIIDYTHTIDISFEERRHVILKRLHQMRNNNNFNNNDYGRIIRILKRTSKVNFIEYDLKAFFQSVRQRIDFDAFYLIPDITHAHILLVLYSGDIKHFIRKAKKRPYCWDIKTEDFRSSISEYLENKVKYLMAKKNFNIFRYEDIVYDFYPDKNRINTIFERFHTIYDYKLYESGRHFMRRLSLPQAN